MCGIAGVTTREAGQPGIGKLADNLLCQIESRGRDATGLLAFGDDYLHLEKNTRRAWSFVQRRKYFDGGRTRTMLLHTRFATVGARQDPANAHPVAHGKVAVVHNGTIWNDIELFEEIGRTRFAEVDSEVLAAIVDWGGWDAIEDMLGLTLGNAACAMIHTDHPDEVVLARTCGFPLVYMVTDDLVVWASTKNAIERAWKFSFSNVRMGEFVQVPEWTVVRLKAGAVVGTSSITIDPSPPGVEALTTQRPSWKPAAPTGHVIVPDTLLGKRYDPHWGKPKVKRTWLYDDRADLLVDRADAEHDAALQATPPPAMLPDGQWTDDGAYELDAWEDDDLKSYKRSSLFDMSDSEFAAYSLEQGWDTEDDMEV